MPIGAEPTYRQVMNLKEAKQNHLNYFYFTMILSEMLGISTFDHETNKFSALKWAHRLAVIILFIFLYFLHLPALMASDLTKEVDPDLMHFEISARFLTSVVVLLVQVLKNHQIKKAFLKCLTYKFEEDDHLLAKYWKFPVMSLTANLTIFIITFFIFHFTYSISTMANLHYSAVVLFYVEFPCLQFNYLVEAIRHYIDKMNDNMEQVLRKIINKNLSKLDARMIANKVKISKEKYLELIEITELTTNVFAQQIIICIADFFFEMTFFLQISLTRFIFDRTEYSSSDAMIFLCNFFVVFVLLLKITQVTINCEECLQKCVKTNVIICHSLNHDSDEVIKSELSAFLVQNINRYITFSLRGFFNLDNKLVYAIICALASYGIIIATYYISLKNSPRQENY